MSHCAFFYHLGKLKKYNFIQFFAKRMGIDKFRNMAAKAALQCEAKYLMFIDDDMLLPHDSFEQLVDSKMDIVSALNYIRGYPFNIMAFKKDPDNANRLVNLTQEDISTGGVIPCEAIGTAVCLIKVDLFKKIPAPWFVTGPHNTEDIYFSCAAKKYVPKVKMGLNTNIITGHLLDPEVISHFTRESQVNYLESFMDQAEKDKYNQKDRGASYVEANINPGVPNSE